MRLNSATGVMERTVKSWYDWPTCRSSGGSWETVAVGTEEVVRVGWEMAEDEVDAARECEVVNVR